jgi:hypothetical protein
MVADQEPAAPNARFGAAFTIYGAALFGVSALSEQAWMKAFALLSLLAGAALCLFANAPWAYLLAAGGSLLVLAIPGVVLLRREPATLA